MSTYTNASSHWNSTQYTSFARSNQSTSYYQRPPPPCREASAKFSSSSAWKPVNSNIPLPADADAKRILENRQKFETQPKATYPKKLDPKAPLASGPFAYASFETRQRVPERSDFDEVEECLRRYHKRDVPQETLFDILRRVGLAFETLVTNTGKADISHAYFKYGEDQYVCLVLHRTSLVPSAVAAAADEGRQLTLEESLANAIVQVTQYYFVDAIEGDESQSEMEEYRRRFEEMKLQQQKRKEDDLRRLEQNAVERRERDRARMDEEAKEEVRRQRLLHSLSRIRCLMEQNGGVAVRGVARALKVAATGSRGHVSSSEILNAFDVLGISVPKKEVSTIIEFLDTDGSGRVAIDTLLSCLRAPFSQKLLRLLNDIYDDLCAQNGVSPNDPSGISAQSVVDACGAKGTYVEVLPGKTAYQVLTELVAREGKDGDGDGKVSRDEFFEYFGGLGTAFESDPPFIRAICNMFQYPSVDYL